MPDEATLNQMIVQYPFTPFSEITTRPILDGDTALRQWRGIMSEMMGAGPGVGVTPLRPMSAPLAIVAGGGEPRQR